jgi:hypothetical protein
MKSKNLFLDKVGVFASSLCALHCSITPFIMTLVPFLGLSFLENELFEHTMIGIAIFLGILSLFPSYLKKHHNIKPIILFLSGISLIISAHSLFHDNGEYIISPMGGFFIVISHLLNLKLSEKKCNYHKK